MEAMKWSNLLCVKRPGKKEIEENPELCVSAFERDYYTIIESSYFRRLQGKTQVYTMDENDFVRNRLTHSMEVSGIAEMMGRRIGKRIVERGEADLPEDFVEKLTMVLRCAGLIHDLGNPPFGHGGERYIREYFEERTDLKEELDEQMWLDLINFDGNAHNVRIVTKLGQSSNPDDTRYGMHPTYALIGSIIKYPYSSLEYKKREDDKKGKIGYYHAEEFIIKDVLKETGTAAEEGNLKNPIMLIMEAADDIAYATADIEDAIKKGYITFAEFIDTLPDEEKERLKENEFSIQKAIKSIRQQSMVDVINCFMDNYSTIMKGEYNRELTDGSRYNFAAFGKLMKKVYEKRDSSSEFTFNSRNMIMEILGMLMEALLKETKDLTLKDDLLLGEIKQFVSKGLAETNSQNWLKEKDYRKELLYHRCLAAVDFVSGMTDNYVKIFSDNWHNENYIKTKTAEYKKRCIERLMAVPSYDGFKYARPALDMLARVDKDEWTDAEVCVILKCIKTNNQISGLCGPDDPVHREAVKRLLERCKGANVFFTEKERKELSALLEIEE